MIEAGPDDAGDPTCAHCSIEQTYAKFGTDAEGLSPAEAVERLDKYGPNVLPEKRKSLGTNFLVHLKNLFNVLLVLAAILCFISGFTAADQSSIQMGIVILIVVIISIVFSLFQEHRAEKALEAIRDLIPATSKVRRQGRVMQVPVSEIVPGDLLTLEAGDKVSADARVVDCYDLSVDNSALTGESEPAHRSTAPGEETAHGRLISCPNLVFAGTTVTSGNGLAIVTATGSNTEFGKVVRLSQDIEDTPSPLQIELNRTARLNFIVAVAVGVLFLLIAYFGLQLELAASLLFMIGVMISLVPEGFQITLTLALALSSLKMSKRNVIVKRLSSVETLGSVTVICSDKTGTITEGQMTVRKVWIGGKDFDVSGEGYEPEGSVFLEGKKVTIDEREDLRRLCEVCCLANTSTVVPPLDRRKSRWTAIGDPTEAALLILATKAGAQGCDALALHPRLGMIPFESNRKMMSSVHRNPSGEVIAYVKGAGMEILARSTSLYWDGTVHPLTDDFRSKVVEQINDLARKAYRVLALAVRSLPSPPEGYQSEEVETQLTFIGLVAILDPPRAETPNAVRSARAAGVRVIMLTGDHELTADAIARSVGIITSKDGTVITGRELSGISDQELNRILDGQELVFARISPEQKLRVVKLLREKGETVAVTGDGVNDAPALLEADIGIAMGLSGTDVARESADMVLLDDNFASIVGGIEIGRSVFENLKKFIVYVYTHNFAELLTFIVFVLLGTPLPLAVVQVLAIDLILEIPPSLALTIEAPEPGAMERPPRARSTRLFNLGALSRSAFVGLIIGAVALIWCFQTWEQAGWSLGMATVPDEVVYLQGITITMAAIMAGQLGMLISSRTNYYSALRVGFASNRWLPVAALVSFLSLLAMVYVPILNQLFSTSPVPFVQIAILYSVVPLVVLVEEVRKNVLRLRFMPSAPVTASPAMPLSASVQADISARTGLLSRPPFIESSPPIAVPLLLSGSEENAMRVAFDLAMSSGSRVIFVRVLRDKTTRESLQLSEQAVAKIAGYLGVPYEYRDLKLPKGIGPRTSYTSLAKAIKATVAARIVVPVPRQVFAGRHPALRAIEWLNEFRNRRVDLVGDWLATPIPLDHGPRILIPVLSEFQGEPFDLAESLTAGTNFPDVDVVAAKVVELPQIVPMYSVYRPESLVDVKSELSIFKSLPKWAIIRRIQPMVLLVREAGKDLTKFAEDRNVDLIIMEGRWSARSRGFLPKKERRIALRSTCTVVVALPQSTDTTVSERKKR
jgi:Ca2+-transporting ATPase